MSYVVLFSPRDRSELASAYRYRLRQAPMAAQRWRLRLVAAVNGLAEDPERWPLAPEAARWKRPIRIRLFGKRRNAFRILFEVEEENVVVLRVRWGGKALLLGKEAP